jgi:hypothetical protein
MIDTVDDSKNEPVTGDAADLSALISKKLAAPVPLTE